MEEKNVYFHYTKFLFTIRTCQNNKINKNNPLRNYSKFYAGPTSSTHRFFAFAFKILQIEGLVSLNSQYNNL